MHLYGSVASPFVQRVLMTARAKGHEVEVRPPPGEGGLGSAEFRAISPMGRVPVLALDDGGTLCESDAIAAYIDETLPGPALMPADALARARVRELVALTMLEVATGLRPLLLHKVFGRGDAPAVVAAAERQVAAGLDALDRLLDAGGPFAAGAAIGPADCALVPVLTLARITGPATGAWALVSDRPRVAAYAARVAAAPVPARTAGEMESAFAAIAARMAAAG